MEESLLTTLFLPLALGFIMLGMGLSLTVADFRRIVIYPKAIWIGLLNQLILLPVFGFVLVVVFGLHGTLAVGVMILAACPGGPTSNLISHLSRADTALSITLTAIGSVITIVTLPFIVNLSISYFGEEGSVSLPVLKTIGQIFVVTLIPVSIGMMIRRWRPDFSYKADKPVRIISGVFFVLIIAAAILKEKDVLSDALRASGLAVISLNILTLCVGYFISMFSGLSLKQRITITIESGIQNGTLGILVAATLLRNAEMTLPIAIYSLWMFLSATVVMMISVRLIRRQ